MIYYKINQDIQSYSLFHPRILVLHLQPQNKDYNCSAVVVHQGVGDTPTLSTYLCRSYCYRKYFA